MLECVAYTVSTYYLCVQSQQLNQRSLDEKWMQKIAQPEGSLEVISRRMVVFGEHYGFHKPSTTRARRRKKRTRRRKSDQKPAVSITYDTTAEVIEVRRASQKRKRLREETASDNVPVSNKRKCIAPATAESEILDPIMLCPLPEDKKKIFEFVRPNGKVIHFAVESLVDYLLSSGRFEEPESRLPFSNDDLKRLDQQAMELELGRASVCRQCWKIFAQVLFC